MNNSVLILSFVFLMAYEQKEVKTVMAHSHNDYEQEHPLFEALKYNFKSVEADIFTVGDSLFVAHSNNQIKPGRTLINLYLEPLKKQIEQNQGSVYGNGEEVFLLIDIKDEPVNTYRLLNKTLEKYRSILSVFEHGQMKPGAIRIIISGNRPFELMKSEKIRFAGFDGRIENFDRDESSFQMPMISDNWKKYFTWDGNGKMNNDEFQKLKTFAEMAKSKGYILRFWGTPDETPEKRIAVWKVLKEADVGIVGADHLKELHDFLLENEETKTR